MNPLIFPKAQISDDEYGLPPMTLEPKMPDALSSSMIHAPRFNVMDSDATEYDFHDKTDFGESIEYFEKKIDLEADLQCKHLEQDLKYYISTWRLSRRASLTDSYKKRKHDELMNSDNIQLPSFGSQPLNGGHLNSSSTISRSNSLIFSSPSQSLLSVTEDSDNDTQRWGVHEEYSLSQPPPSSRSNDRHYSPSNTPNTTSSIKKSQALTPKFSGVALRDKSTLFDSSSPQSQESQISIPASQYSLSQQTLRLSKPSSNNESLGPASRISSQKPLRDTKKKSLNENPHHQVSQTSLNSSESFSQLLGSQLSRNSNLNQINRPILRTNISSLNNSSQQQQHLSPSQTSSLNSFSHSQPSTSRMASIGPKRLSQRIKPFFQSPTSFHSIQSSNTIQNNQILEITEQNFETLKAMLIDISTIQEQLTKSVRDLPQSIDQSPLEQVTKGLQSVQTTLESYSSHKSLTESLETQRAQVLSSFQSGIGSALQLLQDKTSSLYQNMLSLPDHILNRLLPSIQQQIQQAQETQISSHPISATQISNLSSNVAKSLSPQIQSMTSSLSEIDNKLQDLTNTIQSSILQEKSSEESIKRKLDSMQDNLVSTVESKFHRDTEVGPLSSTLASISDQITMIPKTTSELIMREIDIATQKQQHLQLQQLQQQHQHTLQDQLKAQTNSLQTLTSKFDIQHDLLKSQSSSIEAQKGIIQENSKLLDIKLKVLTDLIEKVDQLTKSFTNIQQQQQQHQQQQYPSSHEYYSNFTNSPRAPKNTTQILFGDNSTEKRSQLNSQPVPFSKSTPHMMPMHSSVYLGEASKERASRFSNAISSFTSKLSDFLDASLSHSSTTMGLSTMEESDSEEQDSWLGNNMDIDLFEEACFSPRVNLPPIFSTTHPIIPVQPIQSGLTNHPIENQNIFETSTPSSLVIESQSSHNQEQETTNQNSIPQEFLNSNLQFNSSRTARKSSFPFSPRVSLSRKAKRISDTKDFVKKRLPPKKNDDSDFLFPVPSNKAITKRRKRTIAK